MRRVWALFGRRSHPRSLQPIAAFQPLRALGVEHKGEPVLPKLPRGAEEKSPRRTHTESRKTTKTTTTTYVASASNICDEDGCPIETDVHLPVSDMGHPFHHHGMCPDIPHEDEVVTRVIEIHFEGDERVAVKEYEETDRVIIREGSLEEELRQQDLIDEVNAQVAGEEAEEFDALGNLREARKETEHGEDRGRKRVSRHEPEHHMWERANAPQGPMHMPPMPPRRSLSSATSSPFRQSVQGSPHEDQDRAHQEEKRQQDVIDEVNAQVAGEEEAEMFFLQFDALGDLKEARKEADEGRPEERGRKRISNYEPERGEMWDRANMPPPKPGPTNIPPTPPRRDFCSAKSPSFRSSVAENEHESCRVNVGASFPIAGGYSEESNTTMPTAPVDPSITESEQHVAPRAAFAGEVRTELEEELHAEAEAETEKPPSPEAVQGIDPEVCPEHTLEEETGYGTMLHPGQQTGS